MEHQDTSGIPGGGRYRMRYAKKTDSCTSSVIFFFLSFAWEGVIRTYLLSVLRVRMYEGE